MENGCGRDDSAELADVTHGVRVSSRTTGRKGGRDMILASYGEVAGRFQISDFRFQISDFRFQISD
jgi:hypothetical protein